MAKSGIKHPDKIESKIKKVAILFSGGPAPAANAVISTAAISFLRNGIKVVGIKNGYSHLMNYRKDNPLKINEAFIEITPKTLKRTRNSQGIMIGTARDNPGHLIDSVEDLDDPQCVAPLQTVYDAMRSIGVDALVSIGGDDTLKTANKFKMFQDRMPSGSHKIPVVHVPKTIDNDYEGIDFTFGYFTAVETLAGEIRNLLADAEANQAYFVAETMGRSAGWLAYGAAIAGEASLVISVEDITGDFLDEEYFEDKKTKKKIKRKIMDIDAVINHIVSIMQLREEEEGKASGVIVLAEGLAEYMPNVFIKGVKRDAHGHLAVSEVNLARRFSKLIAREYKKQTKQTKKITGLQLGYEARCARPLAYDVMLGSQLGVGAYLALIEKKKNGVMISVEGQLDLIYVKFKKLVDPKTLITVVRYVDKDSDFHHLVRFLESYSNMDR